MSGIVLAGVRKRFGETSALDGVDLEAIDGELLVVVGPSGCGKSTLLRCVAGLEAVDDGVIRIGERDVTRIRPAARNVSMVFQSYALFPHLTVRENIAFGLVVREEPKAEVKARVAEASKLVGAMPLTGMPNTSDAVMAWMSSPRSKASFSDLRSATCASSRSSICE